MAMSSAELNAQIAESATTTAKFSLLIGLVLCGVGAWFGGWQLQVNQPWLQHVKWLVDEEVTFLADVILALTPAVFAPEESIQFPALFVMSAGVALCGGERCDPAATALASHDSTRP